MIQAWFKQHGSLMWELAKTDFKLRYSGSQIGYVWALLVPLLTFIIINFVFSNVFDRQFENYPLHLLTGLIFWNFFSEGTNLGMSSLVNKRNLVMTLAVSKLAILFSATIQAIFTFALSIIVLTLFFHYYGVVISLQGVWYGFIFFILSYGLIFGFSLAAAPLFVRWRDMEQMWGLALRLGFFAAPIMYPLAIVPAQYQVFLWLNPMAYLIHYVKRALIKEEIIAMSQLALLATVVVVVVTIGAVIFRHTHRRVAEYL